MLYRTLKRMIERGQTRGQAGHLFRHRSHHQGRVYRTDRDAEGEKTGVSPHKITKARVLC